VKRREFTTLLGTAAVKADIDPLSALAIL